MKEVPVDGEDGMGAAELAKGGVGCIPVTADKAPDDRPVLLLGIGFDRSCDGGDPAVRRMPA